MGSKDIQLYSFVNLYPAPRANQKDLLKFQAIIESPKGCLSGKNMGKYSNIPLYMYMFTKVLPDAPLPGSGFEGSAPP